MVDLVYVGICWGWGRDFTYPWLQFLVNFQHGPDRWRLSGPYNPQPYMHVHCTYLCKTTTLKYCFNEALCTYSTYLPKCVQHAHSSPVQWTSLQHRRPRTSFELLLRTACTVCCGVPVAPPRRRRWSWRTCPPEWDRRSPPQREEGFCSSAKNKTMWTPRQPTAVGWHTDCMYCTYHMYIYTYYVQYMVRNFTRLYFHVFTFQFDSWDYVRMISNLA